MNGSSARTERTPCEGNLGLKRIANSAGLSIGVLPNGAVFAMEYDIARGRLMLNQVLGSPLDGSIARVTLRIDGPEPRIVQAYGPQAKVCLGAAGDRFVWDGETDGVHHRLALWLHPRDPVWLWRLEVVNRRETDHLCDAILVQDLGLGDRSFLMNNEAYASQYIDHHAAVDPSLGPVVMSRQNQRQCVGNPWIAHGCLDGATGFATDGMQLFGPVHRDVGGFAFGAGVDLPNLRLQHELACAAIQSRPVALKPGSRAAWTFFGLFEPDHPEPSSDADLVKVARVREAGRALAPREVTLRVPARSVIQDATPLAAASMNEEDIVRRYPCRSHDERKDGRLLSFFIPDGAHNRHVVLGDKERLVARRHGTLLRTGQSLLPDEALMCATCWMHGVFGAQLTICNTSFHKLFSVSRDPYSILRASGLRILVEIDGGWRLLAVPSVFEMGLSDCRWIYRFDDHAITVHAVAAGDEPAMQWRVTVEGDPCRLLVFGHLVLGEREFDHAGRIEVDAARQRFTFRPDPDGLWASYYPDAAYHLVVSAPEPLEAIGGDELLYIDGRSRGGAYAVIRSGPTRDLCFAVVGSLKDATAAERLAGKYTAGVESAAMLAPAARHWARLTRGFSIRGPHPDVAALNTIFPWFAHNALMHLSVPRGLEQYTGAAWGTRDACQGPIEFLLALEHDEPVKEILRILFAEQYEQRGDWPQWFMLEPYTGIRDAHSHGDVVIWPLKALCDYLEATNDLAFLDDRVAWRRDCDLERSAHKDSIAAHAAKLLATVRERFIPGTHLIRYGEGDWNDSLQPADPTMRDWMVSSWSVALLFQQVRRYAEVMRRAGKAGEAETLHALAADMRADFNRWLMRDETVAGYALFDPAGGAPELLLHPSDRRTGLCYSLLPMTRSIIAGLFTPEQARHHLGLIRKHLLCPDGVRLMDKPVTYCGGPERIFRRAESAAFFGREIGLMYVHAHLRYGEAMAALGEADALWEALLVANPISLTDHLAHASLRQRNAYFSSSDAAFADRVTASAAWDRVKRGDIAVDGGWRIYSSGPGLYIGLLLRHVLGRRRYFGERIVAPLLPEWLGAVTLEMTIDGHRTRSGASDGVTVD